MGKGHKGHGTVVRERGCKGFLESQVRALTVARSCVWVTNKKGFLKYGKLVVRVTKVPNF